MDAKEKREPTDLKREKIEAVIITSNNRGTVSLQLVRELVENHRNATFFVDCKDVSVLQEVKRLLKREASIVLN